MRSSFGQEVAEKCANLPSSVAAQRLISGDLTAIPAVGGTTLMRAGLLAGGMLAFGERKNLLRNSIAGAIAIEAFVLGWTYYKRNAP